MKALSVRIRRRCAQWLFVDRQLRATLVAEEYGLSGRCADVIALWLPRDEIRGVYRKVTEPFVLGGRPWTHNKRISEKTIHHPAEVRIVEVKVSRADFLAGIRKGQLSNAGVGFGAFAEYCYLAVPRPFASVLAITELPSGWGLIECGEGEDYRRRSFVSLALLQKPTQLTPSHALSADPDRIARTLAQSALWRLYGFDKKAPDELDVAEAVS